MKIISTAFFLFFFSISYSQSFVELNQKAIELYKQKKLSESIDFGLKALEQSKKESNDSNFNFYLASINLATYYFENKNYYESMNYYKYANLSHVSFYGYDKMFFIYVKNYALCLEKIGLKNEGEIIYNTLIEISKNNFGDTANIYFTSLENIGEFYFRNKEYNKSIIIFSQLEKSIINKESEKYLVSLINLAKSYYFNYDYDNAILFFKKANNYIDILKLSDSNWPIYLNDYLITCYEKTNDFKEAVSLLFNQIEYKYKVQYFFGYISDLNKLSLLKFNNGETNDAIKIINEHINLVPVKTKSDSIYFTSLINNLGYYYYTLNDTLNSFKHYYNARNIIKSTYGESSLEFINFTNAIGVKNHDKGNINLALEFYKEAFQLRHTNSLTSDSGYYYLLDNLILCYNQLSDSINLSKYIQLINNYNLISKNKKQEYDFLRNFNYNELYNKADSFKIANNLIEAKKYSELALNICRESKNIDSANLLSSLFLLANIEFLIGDYNESKKLFQEHNELAKNLFGILNSYYVASLTLLELTNEQLRNFNEAEKLCKDILSIQKIRFSKIDPEYAKACITYGKYLLQTNRFIEAKNYFLEAGSILRTSKKNQTVEYVRYLNNIGFLYSGLNDYKKSIECYDSIIQLYKKIKNVNPTDYIDIYSDIANVYQKKGNYKEGKKYLEKAKVLSIKEYGEKSVQHNYFLLDYADFNVKYGNYKEAEEEYLKVLISFKLNLGTNSEEYLRVFNNLALLYNLIGLNNKSDSLFELSTHLIKKKYGELSQEYALCLNNLGATKYQRGDYKKSEKFFLESSRIRKNIFGGNNPDYASSILNLGLVYFAIGNYNAAVNFTEESRVVFKKNNMEEMYATATNNLGLIYFIKEEFLNAEDKFLESIKIKKKILGENHPDYVKSLTAFGLFYLGINQRKVAEKYIQQSVELSKNIYGENSFEYATSKTLLGLLIENDDKSLAEKYLNQSYQIFFSKIGDNNLSITSPLTGLNILYENQHKLKQADSLLIKLANIYKNLMIKNFEFMSMSQSLEFIKSQEINFSYAYSYLSRNPKSEAVSSLFDMDLFIRNTTLYNLDKLELIAQKNNDTAFLKKWATYKFYKSTLSKSKPQDNTIEIEKNTEAIEKEIMTELPEYNVAIKNNNINWSNIQNKLKPNDAVISYVSFRYYSNLKLTDSILYAAFVIRKDWIQPKYISLCNESQLAEILEINNNKESIDKLYSDTTNGLYNSIWRPLDSLFTGVKRIYLSPISMLNRISFSAISLPEGGKLIDKYDIQILANVRSIAEVSKNEAELKSAFLFGDIDYNNEPLTIDKNISYEVADSASFSSMRSLTNGKWGNLNSTGKEVSSIRNITTGSKIYTTVFTKQNASEENFKNIKSPSILHIATHGFSSPQPKQNIKADYFLEETQKNIFQKSIDPLTRSGLVMSGGNQMWQKGIPYTNHEDEILTAKEVSEMDLSGCILATLSACETGLGDVKGSEGVFGLQRAFKMAGVHYLIVSLWKVPDAETADFMQTFYSKWLKDKNEIKDAFRKTQLEMSDKYNEPYKWAGFVLVE
jgi:CHAT domain-containing protein